MDIPALNGEDSNYHTPSEMSKSNEIISNNNQKSNSYSSTLSSSNKNGKKIWLLKLII